LKRTMTVRSPFCERAYAFQPVRNEIFQRSEVIAYSN
jgi:hypothetical protein